MKRLALESLGWLLVVAGIAALILPGPGLILLASGLALLSQQYEWAERRLEPVRLRALRTAADGVATWPRIVAAAGGALIIGAVGMLWLLSPPAPSWWPLKSAYWLMGGGWTGVTMLVSCVLALALLAYSFRRFHGKPEARAALEQGICRADAADEDDDIDLV
ncbi:MAG: PGPGW domain-containing protein [Nocardioides sp.]|uniref:PGPGW domain-containing protein n=1 Tax=Nocardioides sp. TaxID=35761 RepID=UPI0039E339EA